MLDFFRKMPLRYHLMWCFSLLCTLIFIIAGGVIYTLFDGTVEHTNRQNFLRVLLVTYITALLLIVLLSLLLGKAITRPMTLLIHRLRTNSATKIDDREKANALGEVNILIKYFNNYIDKLIVSATELEGTRQEQVTNERQLKLFAKVFENALEAITITDAEGYIVAVNESFTNITGYQASQVLNRNPRILKSDRHGPEFYREMWRSISEKGNWVGEIWNRRANGEAFPEILSISSICDSHQKITNYVAIFHDITDMKLREEQIKHQAYHDALTGLPNRFLAKDRLFMAITKAKRNQTQVAIFYMDLDNFKYVNDTLGHPAGDVLLQQVGQRLLAQVREEDTVARLGGDEFQIIEADLSSLDDAIGLANRILLACSSPFKIESHELTVTISIGIAIYSRDGNDADTLIKNADIALYQAKHQGKNNYVLFKRD